MTFPNWLNTVHHDGSALYVSALYPRSGDDIQIRLRTGSDAPIRRVYLRTWPNGEQAFTPMQPVESAPPAQWWQAPLSITEPVTNYRFVIDAEDGLWWVTADGPTLHEPTDHADFRILADYNAPGWLQDAVFYQIFPDSFANGDPGNDPAPDDYVYRGERPQLMPWGEPAPPDASYTTSFFGGDLQGIIDRLDYLADLGITALYLNPIFATYSAHGYDVIDFDHVAARLGGDDALIRLREALDARGMRYIMDITPNHCGVAHAWFKAAQADPGAPEAEFFYFRQHPDDYVSWMGHSTLPKLDYRSRELQRRVYSGEDAVFRRWLRPPFRADGWRVDVANMMGRQDAVQLNAEVGRGIRDAVKAENPDAYLVAETFFDATGQLQGDQFDAVMNYMGFATPVWHWLRGYQQGAIGLAEDITSPTPWPTAALAATWQQRRATIPWQIALQQYNLLNSHDTERIRTIAGEDDALHRLAVALQMTVPGVPAVYFGDEIGMTDDARLRGRGSMPWDESRWDHALRAYYRDLIALRKADPVLQRGGFQMLAVEPDSFAFQRESDAGRWIVVAHRGEQPRPAGPLPVAHGGVADGVRFVEHFTGAEAVVTAGALPLPAMGKGAALWKVAENA